MVVGGDSGAGCGEVVGADAAGGDVVGEELVGEVVEGAVAGVVVGEVPEAGAVAWPGVVWAT
jgi:hypothetical protein